LIYWLVLKGTILRKEIVWWTLKHRSWFWRF